jgi:hypothetical protein
MDVIMIAGLKRSGKDTFGKILQEELIAANPNINVVIISFADAMKFILSTTLGISMETLDKFKNDSNYPHREYLQRLGTEAMKPIFGKYVWSDIVNNKLKDIDPNIAIITDFRFPDEYNNMLVPPYTIKVVRDLATPDKGYIHSSEKSLDNFKFETIIENNGTIKDLRVLAKQYIKEKGWT